MSIRARFRAALSLTFLSCAAIAADMPAEGTKAPDFTLLSQLDKEVTLSDLHGKWVVLYFYPKDFTRGCSLEAHDFQSNIEKFQKLNATILGVSADDIDSHKQFCTKEGLDFKLLSDTDHNVIHLYGTGMEHGDEELAARTTFLIDPEGVIRKVYSEVNPAGHSAQVLADLGGLEAKKP